MKDTSIHSGRALVGATLLFIALFGGTAHADTLTLMWDANAEPVSGYAVYTGPSPQALSQRTDVGGATSYTVSNAVPGEQYCFAVAAYDDAAGEGPKSPSVCGYASQAPSLVNPGTLSATVGQPTSLQLDGSDPDGQPLTYSASGLPPGLSLMQSTGFVSGTPSTSGTYQVTAGVSDGVLSDTESFTWTVTSPGPSDTTAPSVSITSPTNSSSYSSGAAAIAMSGTSSDNVGATRVRWRNSRGGSGTAIGVSQWSVPAVTLQPGSNQVTITAEDAAGNEGAKVLNVTFDDTDSTKPTITITSPTSSSTYTNLFSTVTLAGSAADNIGVTSVTWSNDRGGAGTASGTSSWSVPSVSLKEGDNVITVTAHDGGGNSVSDALRVTYVLPGSEDSGDALFELTGLLLKSRWRTFVALAWTSPSGSQVQVYRDGVSLGSTSNDGRYTDRPRGDGPWSYRVCLGDGGACSNTVIVGEGAPPEPQDTTPPSVSITAPTSASFYSTSDSAITLSGASGDDTGVTSVSWRSDRGGSGTASGTSGWTIAGIRLAPGTNTIVVEARDAAGHVGTDTIVVDYASSAPSTIRLDGTLSGSGWWRRVVLSWSSVPGESIDVYRDGSRTQTTPNDGWTIDVPWGAAGPWEYRVCVSGTSICSGVVTITP